eukprot:2782615-Amphidinium_carterae.1
MTRRVHGKHHAVSAGKVTLHAHKCGSGENGSTAVTSSNSSPNAGGSLSNSESQCSALRLLAAWTNHPGCTIILGESCVVLLHSQAVEAINASQC